MTGGGLAVGVCHDTPGDTVATWLRHGAQQRARAQRHGHDTAEGACDTVLVGAMTWRDTAGLGAMHTACACRLGQGVHPVHPTHFLLRTLF